MMNTEAAAYWINRLDLKPHPEGGYYKEMFRSAISVSRVNQLGLKQACTSIYYLLEDHDFSGFHRLESDEIWYYHKGAPLLIHMIDESGNYITKELSDRDTGSLSVITRAGLWFSAEIPSKKGFALASCAVAPGFDFAEFQMAKKQVLLQQFPHLAVLLETFCKE